MSNADSTPDRFTSSADDSSETVRMAWCDNVSEPDGIPCTGTLRFHPSDLQAACDTCGAWCGCLVARYQVDQARAQEPRAV